MDFRLYIIIQIKFAVTHGNTVLSCHNCNDFLVKMERCCTKYTMKKTK